MRILPVFLLLGLVACDGGASDFPATCTLDVPVPEAAALPGASVWAASSPLSSVNDTVVTVGAAPATVTRVDRAGCDECDACRDTESCSVCGDCDSCADACASCVERVQFVVPDVAPGTQALTVRNAYGTSGQGSLTVLAQDTAGVDTGGDSGAR